jgi:hypothetical protein
MFEVVVAALFVKGVTEAERYWRLRSRYVLALRSHQAAMNWYDQGRLDLVKSVLASQRLMEAELALSVKREDQVAALSAHLKRAHDLIEAERKEPLMCHDNRDMWIGEAEASLVHWTVRLKEMRRMR